MSMRPRLVGALLGSLAAFGVAGAGFAGAQETPTTDPPAVETPATPAPGATTPDDATPGRSGTCHHGGSGGSDTATGDTTNL